jgi:CHAT domain-containing protein
VSEKKRDSTPVTGQPVARQKGLDDAKIKRLVRGLIMCVALFTVFAQAFAAIDESDIGDSEIGSLVGAPVARLTPDEALRTLAEPAPPPGTPAEQEIAYLLRRQQASFTVGNGEARIAALRRLVTLTTTPDKLSPYAGYLWREIQRNGNQTEAMEMGERLAEDKRSSAQSRALYHVFLANDYYILGDRIKARSELAMGESLMQAQNPKSTQSARAHLIIEVERVRSIILQWDGDWDGAEASAKKAFTLANNEVARIRKGRASDPMDEDRSLRERDATLYRLISIYAAEGKSAEAELLARFGLRLGQEEHVGGSTLGYWYGCLAQAKLAQRRYDDALEAATNAVNVFKESDVAASSNRLLTVQIYLLQAIFGLERWAEADRVVNAMHEATANDSVARRRFDTSTLQAFLHLVNGRPDAAFKRIDATTRYRAHNYGEAHPLTIEAKSIRAMACQAMGQTRNALSDYAAVFDAIFAPETTFADAEPAGLRGYYTPLALRSYLRLVETGFRESGAKGISDTMVNNSFRVADRLRASVVQQALIDSSARFAATNPEVAELTRREQDERRKAREAIGQLTRQLEEDQRLTKEFEDRKKKQQVDAGEAQAEIERANKRRSEIDTTRATIAAAEKARALVLRDLAQRFPEYQSLVNPKPPLLDKISDMIERDEVLISIFSTSSGTFVWAAGGNSGPKFHYSSLKQSELKALVVKVRATLDQGDRPTPGSVPFDVAAGHRIYSELVAPFAPRFAGARSVIFAVNGDLAQIPLGVLVTDAPSNAESPAWLVRRFAVTQVSTVAAFSALRQAKRREAASAAFVGFGDPAFRANTKPSTPGAVRAVVRPSTRAARDTGFTDADYAELPPLPETKDEVLAIARALGADQAKDVFLGANATRKTVLTNDLSKRRVVAFATHGLKPGDLPGLSRPALALAAPKEAGASPLLLLDDVMGLKLNADWVILSACNTASDDGRAEESFSGLARGFFFAGARSVLATHWAVESRSALELVTRIFKVVANDPAISRAEALRQAQLELIDGKAGDAYRHPFFWAPYALSGDPVR